MYYKRPRDIEISTYRPWEIICRDTGRYIGIIWFIFDLSFLNVRLTIGRSFSFGLWRKDPKRSGRRKGVKMVCMQPLFLVGRCYTIHALMKVIMIRMVGDGGKRGV